MNKKILFAFVATLFFTIPATTVFAQAPDLQPVEYKGESTKFAIMVSHARHYQAAVMTAQQLQIKEKGYQFEIVVVGKLAKELAENSSLIETLNQAEQLGAKTVVCQMAMNFLGIQKEDYDPRIQVTPNAWIYLYELQDQGFNTIEAS